MSTAKRVDIDGNGNISLINEYGDKIENLPKLEFIETYISLKKDDIRRNIKNMIIDLAPETNFINTKNKNNMDLLIKKVYKFIRDNLVYTAPYGKILRYKQRELEVLLSEEIGVLFDIR